MFGACGCEKAVKASNTLYLFEHREVCQPPPVPSLEGQNMSKLKQNNSTSVVLGILMLAVPFLPGSQDAFVNVAVWLGFPIFRLEGIPVQSLCGQ